MKQGFYISLYMISLSMTALFLSCMSDKDKKCDRVVLRLEEVRDSWSRSSQLLEGKTPFERDIYLTMRLKNDGLSDAFVPIHSNDPLCADSIYQSRLALYVEGHEILCEVDVERKLTLSSVPNVLYLRQYEVDQDGHSHVIKEKQLYSGDLGRKIYAGDSLVIFIHINKNQLCEAGLKETMDVHELLGKMVINYEKDMEDLKFDNLPISDICIDLQNPVVKID